MAVITLLSDFGYKDYYVAALKAGLATRVPNAQVIDITHGIEPFNIAQAAYVLNSVFRDFPVGSVHIVAVDTHGSKQIRFIAQYREGHYFICSDNALLSLLNDQEPETTVEIEVPEKWKISYPSRQILVRAAADLFLKAPIESLGNVVEGYKKLLNRQLKLEDHKISGNVIYIDHYGNLITNITRDAFDAIGHDRAFFIRFGRESINRLDKNYNEQEAGDCICLFNDQQLLEIAIMKGNAAELLGMHYDSKVTVQFYTTT